MRSSNQWPSMACYHVCTLLVKENQLEILCVLYSMFGLFGHASNSLALWAQMQNHLGTDDIGSHSADMFLSQSRVGCIIDSSWPLILNEEVEVNIIYNLQWTKWPGADTTSSSSLCQAMPRAGSKNVQMQPESSGCRWLWLDACLAGAQHVSNALQDAFGGQLMLRVLNPLSMLNPKFMASMALGACS